MTDINQENLILFINMRLDEDRRLARSLAALDAPNVQAAADQLGRLIESVDTIVAFVQHYTGNPLNLPILRKIANNWSYHSDFDESWK